MGKQSDKKSKKWKIAAGIILVIQALISIVSVGIVVWFNLLPLKYLVLIGLILIWLLTLVYYFFYSGVRKKKGKKLTAQKKKRKLYIKRSIGGVISAITMALCIVASSMVWQAGNALANIADNVVVTDTVSVYALADNPAESVADIKDGVFAITQNYDYEHTKTTLDKIRENLGQDVHTQNYDTVFDMVDALYAGNVDAMILNVAYVDVIRDQKGYEDFSDRTKTLYDHEVKTSVAQENTQDTRDITKDPFIIYISGSDTRNLKLATSRSDVNILAVVNPASKQVLLLNTPRDYYVETTVSGGMRDKLTHCGIYGIDCSMGTLTNLYEENVDYYVQINFNGFETLIDAIGGITVEAEKSFRTSEGGYYISQGTNQLSGAVALSYVRERKSFADGDNARGRHQMQAIEAIIKKVSSGTTVLNNYSAILSMEGMFATNMSSSEISALVRMQLTDMASWNVKSFAVTGTGSSQKTYSMPTKRSYVMIPDESQIDCARKLVDKVIDGGILSDGDLVMPTVQ